MKFDSNTISSKAALFKLVGFSILGILFFFVPFTYKNKKTILFDHIATYIVTEMRFIAISLLLVMMFTGTVLPFFNGNWKKSLTQKVLSFLKIFGVLLAVLYLTGLAPEVIMQKDMMPFLFEKLALPVGMIVPVGALFLSFLVAFGLLECIGVLMHPIMKPIWKTPGASAIDAVASFVGSYSIGLLITNRVYLQGTYSAKEAAIIATGFSTVSAAFMIIVAKTLGLMESWNLFFWSSLFITFAVTAITARIPPISMYDNTSKRVDHELKPQNRLKYALEVGIEKSSKSGNILSIFTNNFWDGVKMSSAIVSTIIAVGLIGLLLVKFTPLFDLLGLFLYPFTWIAGLSDPLDAAKGISTGLAEMFLPALILKNSDILIRFTAAITSISSVIFLSGMVPCVLATKIPISIGHMLIIWFERTALSILLAAIVGHISINLGILS